MIEFDISVTYEDGNLERIQMQALSLDQLRCDLRARALSMNKVFRNIYIFHGIGMAQTKPIEESPAVSDVPVDALNRHDETAAIKKRLHVDELDLIADN